MQPTVFSLILITAHVSVTVDCRSRLQQQQLQQHPTDNSGIPADLSAGPGRFHSEPSRSVRNGMHRGFLAFLTASLPVRTATNNFVPTFDWRRKQLLHKSRQKDFGLDLVFHRIWSDMANHHDVLLSTSGNRLLRVGGRDLQVVHQQPSEVSSALLERFPLVRRQRRSGEVNPSDPLRSESNPSHSAKDADGVQPEQEQIGSVSKETITSVDDPLWVLRPNGHGSPVKTNIADRSKHK
ncbi:uncharacterized protein LOC121647971 [Melanotaenia boesemani]|uniref:uncharacterized protein LOC121647971 n=1 Tax=Melanotaenia boesemani TaxID=1250792 RepID=UPI001C04DAB5|nr:uncharacterized protein LOC121647971 [Melanotaenia boesemani]